jgi:hypothetical protein
MALAVTFHVILEAFARVCLAISFAATFHHSLPMANCGGVGSFPQADLLWRDILYGQEFLAAGGELIPGVVLLQRALYSAQLVKAVLFLRIFIQNFK